MRRGIYFLLLSSFLFHVSGLRPVSAQDGKGSISGTVKDSSGGALKGALVELDPTGAKTVSDEQGQFRITDVAAGQYTVTVSYVGLANFTKAVQVIAGQGASTDAVLNVAAVSDQMVVTADRVQGEAESINVERTADNIIQVLPAEVIRSLPNANMADALGRLPSVTLERDEGEGKYVQVRGLEPRLTNTMIDGMDVPSPESGVRQIKFDSIPADIVESVEINKTLLPNMDGDGIGGSVNLITKSATDQPTINLSGMGGFMPILGGRGQVETTGTIGQRFGSQKRFGALIGGSYDWTGRGIDDVEPTPDIATLPGGGTERFFDTADMREYRYYRSRWGLAGSLDYRLTEGSNLYAHGLFSNFKNYGDRFDYGINDNTPGVTTLNGNGGTPSFGTQIRRPDISVGSVLIGGRHDFNTILVSWNLSAGRASLINQGDGLASFGSTLPGSSCQFSPSLTTNFYEPQFTPVCFTEAFNTSAYALNQITINHGLTAQLNLQFDGEMAKRYHIGSHPATFEFGGKFRNAHKFDDAYSITTTPNSGVSIPVSQFPNDLTNNNYYGGAYKLGPNPAFQDILNFANANPSEFTIASSQGVDPSNYDLVEKVSAGYIMNTVDLTSKLRVVGGIRFEGTNLSTVSFDQVANTLSFKANGSYLSILPSAAIRYAVTPSTNFRLSYSRGLSRPDPQDIAQAVTYTTIGSPGIQQNTVNLGNPNLKAETGDSIDFLVEHYLNSFGMISVGYFYKNLTNPIVQNQFFLNNFSPNPVIPPQTFLATQPINAGSAWLNGVEFAYLQHLSFLPGPFKGLGISANYSYVTSRASGLPGRSDHPLLLRDAPNTWNISPTYDMGRFSVRVGLSYNQANISSYAYQDGSLLADGVTHSTPTPGGINGPLSDQYFYTHLQVDAQGSIRLAHGFTFVMYGLNLTNEVFGFYQGSTQYQVQREFYEPTVSAGFRWSPEREKRP
ncbi:MAG TPA: TonB-dependent receptor [Candidatus Acidoferrales bacterium]|jgi:TonB-dependent receptor|nr:TonB-dependent receptor [Candidatus Acidoferrales bacterium]